MCAIVFTAFTRQLVQWPLLPEYISNAHISTASHLQVEEGAIVAAGSVVTAGTTVPSGELWGGNPARKLRDVAKGKDSNLAGFAAAYVPLASQHKAAGERDVFTRLQERVAALPPP